MLQFYSFLWSLWLIPIFFVMQISMYELRSEMLSYMLYHQHNQRKMLPYGLEEYRQSIEQASGCEQVN
jgi:hypothetical protein